MSFRLSPKAREDLRGIWRHTTAHWGRAQANKYLRALGETFDRLAAKPDLGRSCNDLRPGYRRIKAQAHVIFFRMDGGGVEIVRILHQSMDFRRHL